MAGDDARDDVAEKVAQVTQQPRTAPRPRSLTETLELPGSARPDSGAEVTETQEVDIGSVPYDLAADLRQDPSIRPLFVLAQTLEERYPDLAMHGRSVAGYCALVARDMGFAPDEVERVALAGELHDVGKVAVADEVLRKPGALDEAEWAQVMRHPQVGADLLVSSNLDTIARWVLAHHERPDGTGYPYRVGDEEIAMEAKILAVGDAYDAMRTDRVYKAACTHDEAAVELRNCADAQFDGTVVESLLAALDRLGFSG